ncbi:hypothetical protein AGABI2DRAFT_146055 [Agaricus bisporus var. bisporus H97]|uniref:hypothetical protein n=1 Tax=Agaricus bisporus var. bisporus (strain H97 / ATCC MYA-4626 / FGSC 10389) TaxID=936046 RepID=UPI00029F51E3|nr:hypothetical protein AGABI2DRAFT_146055 [Agaricus bisporus var. bisporus H97]EKV43126.1 hypothetical protein AGABI2DRAFT_146055 [Agaricus bisporus var. bisporus H97]
MAARRKTTKVGNSADALFPTQLEKLQGGGACLCNGTRMKTMILELVSGIFPECRLDLPLSSAKKVVLLGAGAIHSYALLIPVKHLVAYKEDSAKTISKIDSSLIISGRDFPAFLYPLNNNYNPKRPQDGLFWETLWMHSYFAMSSAKEWRANMGTFDKKEFFDAMVAERKIGGKKNYLHRQIHKSGIFSSSIKGSNPHKNIFGYTDSVIVPAKRSYKGPSDVDIFLQQINDNSSSEADDGQENAANSGNCGDSESEAESNAENAGNNGANNGGDNGVVEVTVVTEVKM